MTKQLSRELHAQKQIATYLTNNLTELQEFCEEMEGKKLFKVDGGNTALYKKHFKLERTMPKSAYKSRVHYMTVRASNRSLYLDITTVTTWETFPNDEHKCDDISYTQENFYIGELESDLQTLKSWSLEFIQKRTANTFNLDPIAIDNTRATIVALYKQIEDMNSELPYYAKVRSSNCHLV